MSIKLIIYDGATPMLDKIATIHYGMGLDVLDQAGQKMRKSIRMAMALSSRHNWQQEVRMITRGKNKGKNRRVIFQGAIKEVGSKMMNHSTGSIHQPGNMKHLISSYLMERKMTMVVGGMSPRHTPVKRRDGKIMGKLNRQPAITKGSYAILKKLNSGDANDADYKAHARAESIERFKNAHYKPRRFVEKGRAMAMPAVMNLMTNKLEKMIGQQVNKETVKARRIA
jgi:hypothetical protein